MRWIWRGTKFVLFGGALYGLAEADIWGKNDSTINYLNKQCESCNKIKYYKQLIPSCEEIRTLWADSWNNGVRSVFDSIDRFPENTAHSVSWVSTQVRDFIKVQEASKEIPLLAEKEIQKKK